MAGLKILLVDDEAELVHTVAERLQLRGHEVDALTKGAEALEHVAQNEYDVAVVDLKMPGLSGMAVLDGIKQERPNMPVILLTGHGLADEGKAGLKHGAAAYLFKPVKIDDLIEAMQNAIRSAADE
jgi:DNA-binding NtrC family response regulator